MLYSVVNYLFLFLMAYYCIHLLQFIHSYFLFLFFVCLLFWPRRAECGILIPQPGIEPMPPALGAQSLNHWKSLSILLLMDNQTLWGHFD